MNKYSFDAAIFDLDGVITKTAKVHAEAWKQTFDEYLKLREKRDGEAFKEFSKDDDYLLYVDGKPRYEGIKSFLESRKIEIPMGDLSDSADKETVCGLGTKKNAKFRYVIKKYGVEIYPSTLAFLKSLKECGVKIGVASSSKNCQFILQASELEDLFETRVDGEVSAELGLKGKPEADIFVRAANNLGVVPANSIVIEDANSGVQAGRNGGFGLVLGVARKNNEFELLGYGADIAVRDLSEISFKWIERWFHKKPKSLFGSWHELETTNHAEPLEDEHTHVVIDNLYNVRTGKGALITGKKLVFFLDYDGTLTPIVDRPDLAIMAEDMRDAVKAVAKKHMVAIVSGRMREDVQNLVKIDGIFYAGSHGFDIEGPGGFSMIQPKAKESIPVVSRLIETLKKELKDVEGALVEEKKFSVAVHYRLVKEKYWEDIKKVVEKVVKNEDMVRLMSGKMVYEILPNMEWDKGKAIRWIMDAMKISWSDSSIVYIGDDVTDEFAFRAIRTRGTGILVADQPKESAADFRVETPDDVKKIFSEILEAS